MNRKIIAVLVLATLAVAAHGTTVTQNVDFGFNSFSLSGSDGLITEAMMGVSYRYISYPDDFGFYLGFDGTMAFPTYTSVYKNDNWVSNNSNYAQALYFMMPLGYRWPGAEKGSGFFLGGGPAMQFFYGLNVDTLFGLGVTSELGYETNMTEGSQFHFAWQFGWSPGVWGFERGYITSTSFNSALRFGISWRRVKPAE
jgi:hypothetical protein